MNKKTIITFGLATLLCIGCQGNIDPPNIVFILADDMGVGDVSGLNPEGKIHTPNIDSMIERGLTFTDAHSPAAVCTPTRYGFLTGRYYFRAGQKVMIADHRHPPVIEQGRTTLPGLLKSVGYKTAIIGKWHLGIDLPKKPGGVIDFSQPISNGPLSYGFDTYFGLPHSANSIRAFIRDDMFDEIPAEHKPEEWILKIGLQAVKILPRLEREAVEFIRQQERGKPFFLYLPLTAPHLPVKPSDAWKGKSGIGAYGDFVAQTDGFVGSVQKALEEKGLEENTILIFTADNGVSPFASSYHHLLTEYEHAPSYVYRGNKWDAYEGGHRVPFVVQWPEQIKAARVTNTLIDITDMMRTVADMLEIPLEDNEAEDSISFLPTLLGQANPSPRGSAIYLAEKFTYAIRKGDWKLILHEAGSAGFYGTSFGKRYREDPTPVDPSAERLPAQLYDLSSDVGEYNNVVSENKDIALDLLSELKKAIEQGRITPGAKQSNTGFVRLGLKTIEDYLGI